MLRFIRHVLRVFSYLFLAIHFLFALALSAVILMSPHQQTRLGWLPWTGDTLGAALAVFGLTGLILLFLAILGRARLLLMLFVLAALVIVTRGFFFSSFRFDAPHAAQDAVHVVLGMFLAFLGAIPMRRAGNLAYRGSR